MTKKRKQAVGREVIIHLDELRAYELNLRAARWKAAATQWRAMAMATNPASMPWRKFRRELIRLGLQEKDDD